MKILGIDPGLASTGYGVVLHEKGKPVLVEYGCIGTSKAYSQGMRLERIGAELRMLIGRHQPDHIAIEKLFFSKNVKTAMVVSEARGVAMLVAQESKVPVVEFTPPEVKQAITSYGNAGKREVQKMLTLLFNLPGPPEPDDAADAVAIAYCCVQNLLYRRSHFTKGGIPRL